MALFLAGGLVLGVTASPAWAAAPGTPPQPSVSAGNGQIIVTFSAPASNGGKTITKYTASCAPIDPNFGVFAQASNAGAVAPIAVTGLTNGAGYTCSVHATNADGTSNESPDSAVVVVGAPATPSQPLATAGHAQISVAFSPPNNNGSPITSYSASCSSATGAPGTNTGASSPINITVLTNGATYTCTVSATNSLGTSAPSPASAPVTPFVSAPGAPPTPIAARGDTKIGVIFSPPSDNGGSPINFYTASCTGSGTPGSATGNASPITVTGLTNGGLYTCTVTATNAFGTSPPSPPSATVQPEPVPDAPPQPTVVAHPGSIAVTFGAAIDNGTPITSYTATCTSNDGGVPAAHTGPTSPITVTGLSNARTYTCTVTATSATGTGPPSVPSLPVIPTTVPAPPILRIAGPGDGAAIVLFTPSNGGGVNTNFKVACTSSNGGAPGLIAGPKSPITVPGLSNGKIYTCAVRATNAIGTSGPSALSRPFIVGAPGAPVVTHVVSTLATGSRATLNVTFNPGPSNGSTVSAYVATCRQDFTGTPTIGSSLSSPVPVGNLLNGHGYTCSVVATNTRGSSAASNAVHGTVGTPAVPAITRAQSIRAGVVVAFAAPAGNGSAINYYQARCASSNGGTTNSSLQLVSPVVVNNLTPGRTYTCTLSAVNARGAGAPATTASIVVSATQPVQFCHGATGLLRATPGLQFSTASAQTLSLAATFGACTGPYVQQAKLSASFKTKSISCQSALGLSVNGTGTFTWTAPAGLGTSTASIQLTINSTAGHTTLATFSGTVTTKSNLFTNARISGTLIVNRGLGATGSGGGDCTGSGRLATLAVLGISMTLS